MSHPEALVLVPGPTDAGKRLDRFLQEQLPAYTRSRIQQWIKAGRVSVDGRQVKAGFPLRGGEQIQVCPEEPPPLRAFPEPIPIRVLYEDQDVIAVDKPAGMVVHAGAGVREGTLVNALLYRFGQLGETGDPLRPGIVHRLDRWTSGVLLVARNERAHQALASQFASREVEKYYLALVHGQLPQDAGKIDAPIARDPRRRTRMTARSRSGRAALTFYRVLERLPGFTYVEVRIATGRTHQIRTHFSAIGHPVVGDPTYGAPRQIPGMPSLGRYFLHAWKICFRQPSSGQWVTVESPLPAELDQWLQQLRHRLGVGDRGI